jgi:hypothetical protein
MCVYVFKLKFNCDLSTHTPYNMYNGRIIVLNYYNKQTVSTCELNAPLVMYACPVHSNRYNERINLNS